MAGVIEGQVEDLSGWQLDLLNYPTFRMTLLAKVMDRLTIRQLAEHFDISFAQWRVIARLGGAREGATVGRIADQAWVDRAEVSRAASFLETKGYLEKKENPHDRRASVLVLTSSGRNLYRRVAKKRTGFHERLIEDLDSEDLAQLDRLIDCIRAKLETMAGEL